MSDAAETERKCSRCGEVHPIERFYLIKKDRPWRLSYCRECVYEANRRNKKPDREKQRESCRSKRQRQKERMATDPQYAEYITAQIQRHRDKAKQNRAQAARAREEERKNAPQQPDQSKQAKQPKEFRPKQPKHDKETCRKCASKMSPELIAQSRRTCDACKAHIAAERGRRKRARKRERIASDPEYRSLVQQQTARANARAAKGRIMPQGIPFDEEEKRGRGRYAPRAPKQLILTDPKPSRPVKYLPCPWDAELNEIQEWHEERTRSNKGIISKRKERKK